MDKKTTHAHFNTCRAHEVRDHSLFLSPPELKEVNTCVSKADGRVKETVAAGEMFNRACVSPKVVAVGR